MRWLARAIVLTTGLLSCTVGLFWYRSTHNAFDALYRVSDDSFHVVQSMAGHLWIGSTQGKREWAAGTSPRFSRGWHGYRGATAGMETTGGDFFQVHSARPSQSHRLPVLGIVVTRYSDRSSIGPTGPRSSQPALTVLLPYSTLLVLSGVPPIVWLGCLALRRCWCRRHEMDPNHCRVCGYDLRATPARCPECGTAAS